MTDATTTTIEADAPLKRERDDIVRTRRELVVSPQMGALLPTTFEQVMELGQNMAKAGVAVPAHLRGNPGACIAVIFYALEWRMSIYGVANKSYSVKDRLAFEAQLIHAVIEMRAPLEERLKSRFEGDGDAMKCFVWAKVKGEEEPLMWESPPIGDIKPKNSPLWGTDPRQQLWYYTSRTWARRWFPEILLGLYSKDELEDSEEARAAAAKDVTPAQATATTLAERLMGTDGREGFRPDELEEVANGGGALGRAEPNQSGQPEPTTKPKRQRKPREEVMPTETGGQPSPSTPETTPPSAAAATAPEGAEASFVDLVTDMPARLKDVTPPKPAPEEDAGRAQAKAQQWTRQISTGETRTEPEPAKSEEPPPAAPAKPKAPPPPPRNPEEYFDHLRTWLNRTTDIGWITDYYASKKEREIRGAAGVIGDHRIQAEKIRDDYIKSIS